MNSIGVFREKEIHGKTFLIYTLLSQKDNPTSFSSAAAIDSCGNDLSLHPLFICPSLRLKAQKLKYRGNFYTSFDISPYFPNDDPQVQYMLNSNIGNKYFLDSNIGHRYLLDSNSDDDDDEDDDDDDDDGDDDDDNDNHDDIISKIRHRSLLDSNSDDDDEDDKHDAIICKLPVVPLFWCNNKEPDNDEFYCGACHASNLGTSYYFCLTCGNKFHKECVESPLEIKHPSHPSHPFLSFQLYSHPLFANKSCICCGISLETIMYYCPTYSLRMHPVCAMKPIPIVIDYPKRHPHPLTFFPKQASLPCDICGLVNQSLPTYVCVRCVFVVHQECIYSPHVIKISRHHHRISFTSSLPPGKWSCGVCRRKVDNNCGAYSCNKCDDYFFHTKCALRKDVWDGIELEGVCEEPEIILEPFEMIADGIILHFSHDHHLKLHNCRFYDEEKFCQACVLPIYEGNYYSCIDQCDFILHETCANATRLKHHVLYPQPLTLKVVTDGYNNHKGYFNCDACCRPCCGFVYEFLAGDQKFRLDLRCASVYEPFEYPGHEHPLFLSLMPEDEAASICHICQDSGKSDELRKFNCIDCDYIICFTCATLPYKAKYKHDKHFLTFWKGKETSDHSGWCEVCEKNLEYSIKGGFYACDDCCTTLHVHCLLGEDLYMLKPGKTIEFKKEKFHIVRNSTLSRPLCRVHDEVRCSNRVFFKSGALIYCSFRCRSPSWVLNVMAFFGS